MVENYAFKIVELFKQIFLKLKLHYNYKKKKNQLLCCVHSDVQQWHHSPWRRLCAAFTSIHSSDAFTISYIYTYNAQ